MGPRNKLQVSYYAPSCTCDIPDGYESLQDRIRRPFPMGCVLPDLQNHPPRSSGLSDLRSAASAIMIVRVRSSSG